ncbi:hypothetical protein VdG1_03151 [Verticillium dahliae VDG1]|nr:hypothetical protein VdG1_03151 [Verticillium dahliae VDG1]
MSPSLQLPLLDGDEPRGEYEPLHLKGRPGRPRERSFLWLKAITTAVVVLITILVLFFPDDARHYLHLPPPSSGHHTPTRDRIQDIAFAPGGWGTGDVAELFAPHFGEKSNLEGKRQGDELDEFDEGPGVVGNNPPWARDWSFTYLLHAFRPGRASKNPWGFEAITPRYVFERQSNFARAVYPVAKDMYDRKIIQLDDSHEG